MSQNNRPTDEQISEWWVILRQFNKFSELKILYFTRYKCSRFSIQLMSNIAQLLPQQKLSQNSRNAQKCTENTNSSVDERTCRSVGVSATHGNAANLRNLAVVTAPHKTPLQQGWKIS